MSTSTQRTCPLCGAELKLRTARRGESTGEQFFGCVRYPQCIGSRETDGRSIDLEVDRIWQSPRPIATYRELVDRWGPYKVCNRFERSLARMPTIGEDDLPKVKTLMRSTETQLATSILDVTCTHPGVHQRVHSYISRTIVEHVVSTCILLSQGRMLSDGYAIAGPSHLHRLLKAGHLTSSEHVLTAKRTMRAWGLALERLLSLAGYPQPLYPSYFPQPDDTAGFMGGLASCVCVADPPKRHLHLIAGLVRADDLLLTRSFADAAWHSYVLGKHRASAAAAQQCDGQSFGTMRDRWLRRDPLTTEALTIAELRLELRLHKRG